jgi:hypothetical protein
MSDDSTPFDCGQKVGLEAPTVYMHAYVGIVQSNSRKPPIGDRLSAGEFSVQFDIDEHALRSGQTWIFRNCDR